MRAPSLYWYKATVVKPRTKDVAWPDVDTVHLDIDHGRNIWDKMVKHRLARIDGYGNNHPLKTKGVEYINRLVPTGTVIHLETIEDKTEKWGRYLAEIWMGPADNLVNVNDLLVKQGLALYWNGQGPHPTGEVI